MPDQETLRRIREVLTDKYLAGNPGYDRLLAKLAKHGFVVTREELQPLMKDVRSLDALLTEFKVDTGNFDVTRFTVNQWDGKSQVKATLEPRAVLPDPATPRKLKPKVVTAKSAVRAMIIPDIHFGFFDDGSPTLQTIHDPAAVACGLSAAAHLQPKTIVLLGDALDLAPFGSFPTDPGLRSMTQHALQAAYDFLASLREACPESEIIYLEGNHERRIHKALSVGVNEALLLKRPGDKHKVFSIHHLLRLEELNVSYVTPYGSSCFVADTRCTHGELIGKSGGESVSKMLRAYPEESTAFGHTHRLELAWRTLWWKGELRHIFSLNCGTWARLDNAVPGSNRPDWMQGFGLLWESGKPEAVPIINGKADVNGVTFSVAT